MDVAAAGAELEETAGGEGDAGGAALESVTGL